VTKAKFTAHPNPALMDTDIRALKVKDHLFGKNLPHALVLSATTALSSRLSVPLPWRIGR
jgi:hypothetical protein